MNSISSLLIKAVKAQKDKEMAKNIWAASPWKDVATLENNNVGLVGEDFISQICAQVGIASSIDGSKTKELGGGAGDGTVKGRTVEIKTARQGTGSGKTFQHELGEKPWLAEFMLFVDVTPENFFLTVFENFTEAEYKARTKCKRVFTTKTVTWRKKSGAFKLDTSVKLDKAMSGPDGNTLCWSPTTTDDEVKQFLDRHIKEKVVESPPAA